MPLIEKEPLFVNINLIVLSCLVILDNEAIQLQHLHLLRSRSEIAKTVDVWKRAVLLKLVILRRQIINRLIMTW